MIPKTGRLYAHWLDSEWNKIAHSVTIEGQAPYHTLQSMAEGALKLHALFGTKLAISDVQLTDSMVVVRLFANPEFRDYLHLDKEFLTLVALPRGGISDNRLATATKGIDRATQPGWTTSLLGMPVAVVQQFAETILNADRLDTERCLEDRSSGPGRVAARYPEHAEVLEGMLRGICHFVEESGGPVDRPSITPRAYTDVIREALNSGGVRKEDLEKLESVWNSIEVWVPDEQKRFARSSLISAMESQLPDRRSWPPDWHMVWNTVVHAWNSNVCDTIGTLQSSIVTLPGAVVLFRGGISDLAGPYIVDEEVLRQKKYSLLSLNPSTLSWARVTTAIKETLSERQAFQDALLNGESNRIVATSEELIKALMNTLIPSYHKLVPDWVWAPVQIACHFLGPDIPFADLIPHAAKSVDEMQARVLNLAKRTSLLNTLHGFNKELISTYATAEGELHE